MKAFSILYKDKNIVIINKTAGIDISECTDKLLKHLTLSTFKTQPKDYYISPVYELDRAISGVQMYGLNPNITRELERSWNAGYISREYLALVRGNLKIPGMLNFALEDEHKAKRKLPATTHYAPIKTFETTSFVRVWTDNEYKHQIRRHFSRRCMNVIGDRKFGQKSSNDMFEDHYGLQRIFLHAHYLRMDLRSYNRTIEISCSLPPELKSTLEKMICFSQPQAFATYNLSEELFVTDKPVG